jgi:hypothetical protein
MDRIAMQEDYFGSSCGSPSQKNAPQRVPRGLKGVQEHSCGSRNYPLRLGPGLGRRMGDAASRPLHGFLRDRRATRLLLRLCR